MHTKELNRAIRMLNSEMQLLKDAVKSEDPDRVQVYTRNITDRVEYIQMIARESFNSF